MWKNVRILKDSNFLWKCFLFVLLESWFTCIWFWNQYGFVFFFLLFIQFPHEYCFSYALKRRSEFLFPKKNFLYKEFNFLTRILHTTVRGTFPNSNPVPIRLNKISLSLSSTCIQLRYLGDNFNSKNFTIDRILHSFDRKVYMYIYIYIFFSSLVFPTRPSVTRKKRVYFQSEPLSHHRERNISVL